MKKYSFLIYHKEYSRFLKDLQELGAIHVIEKKTDISDISSNKYQRVNQITKIIRFLEKREIEKTDECPYFDGLKIIDDIIQKQQQLEELQQQFITLKKELSRIEPWGNFSTDRVNKLKDQGLFIRFFTVSKKKFSANLISGLFAEVISESKNSVYFIIMQHGIQQLSIDANEIELPSSSLSEIKMQLQEVEEKISLINKDLDNYAKTSIPLIEQERNALSAELIHQDVMSNTTSAAEDKMKILEGWVPDTKKEQIKEFLKERSILHIIENPAKIDKVPILLHNNRFSKLFEPIGKLYSLPTYSELDLTIFFAPFFMLFFGFCLGDAGYGLLFIIGAGLYKLKAQKGIKPILSLIQILGLATIIFGIISGTFFGINLIETNVKFLADYKSLFLNPDNMFNLALILGAIQIIFGIFIKAINQIRQYGFMHSIATVGWLVIIIGSGIYAALTKLDFIDSNKIILYSILGLGISLLLVFSDMEISIFARIGKGLWDIYSTVTGIFGDLLSYIRLFALGLSSAILGFVINDIAMQILKSSPIIGPVFFVVFLLLGHGLNILIASLGSFVHPMRLTFVEFYKNAGFTGGGKIYSPFKGASKAEYQ